MHRDCAGRAQSSKWQTSLRELCWAESTMLLEQVWLIFENESEIPFVFFFRDLVAASNSLIYMGFMRPGTLFVSAPSSHLNVIRAAWARRILKAPESYAISSLGEQYSHPFPFNCNHVLRVPFLMLVRLPLSPSANLLSIVLPPAHHLLSW